MNPNKSVFRRRHLLIVCHISIALAMSLASCGIFGGCPSDPARFQVKFTSDDAAIIADAARSKPAKKPAPKPQTGDIIVFGGATKFAKTISNVAFYDPNTQKWTSTTPLPQAGAGVYATELNVTPLAGQILVGEDVTGKVSRAGKKTSKLNITVLPDNAEIFNPSAASFTSVGKLLAPRTGYTQTLLPNGKVLIAGGIDASIAPTIKAELFDPSTSTFTATGDMNTPRALHTATLLGDGTVLIAGGLTDTANDTSDTAEIYDPSTGKFTELSATIPIDGGVAGQTATAVSGCQCPIEGFVLLAGGYTTSGEIATSGNDAVLYDPVSQTFSTPGQMTDFRVFHSATALPDGKVLIAGGIMGQALITNSSASGIFGGVLNSAEVFNPVSETFACVNGSTSAGCNGSMVNSRAGQAAVLMTSGPLAGQVLLAGGAGARSATAKGRGSALKTAELYNQTANKFTPTGSMKSARVGFAAALLQ